MLDYRGAVELMNAVVQIRSLATLRGDFQAVVPSQWLSDTLAIAEIM